MREILFRGKRKDNGEWVEGFYHYSNWINPITKELVKTTYCILPLGYQDAYKVIPETIGQYTGLTDKNGKKIFEGDILQVDVQEYKDKIEDFWGELRTNRVFTGKYRKELWSVEYKEHFCKGNGFYGYGKDRRFNINLTKSTLSNVNAEIIGNIHDNPELLKGGAE